MKKICRVVSALFFTTISLQLFSQKILFSEVNESSISVAGSKRVIIPQKYKTFSLDKRGIEDFLKIVPSENNFTNRNAAPLIELPMPGGKMARFRIWESPVMEPALATKYPEIKTFSGQGIDDPYATIRMDYNPYFGLSAEILSVNGNVYIDPYARGNLNYLISYYRSDYIKNASFVCSTVGDIAPPVNQALREQAGFCRGTQLFTYRLALACTGEYAQFFLNGSELTDAERRAKVLAAMVTSVNRVNAVYESELSVHLTLVANNDLLIYLDGTTDPYTNNNGSTMLGQNQTTIDNVIGSANYDIGHVFSTGGGGVATLGIVCNGSSKARGVTGSPNPTGDAYDIDYVAHEMGHQFGATHSFNSVSGSCNGNRTASAAYEVGSSTTIMGYAGICGSDNIQPNSDPFFHTVSFDQISTFLQGNGGICATVTATGNNLPQITAMNNNGANIPVNTPFTLTATATDIDGDALTYDWEEWDLGSAGAWNSGASTIDAPLFKSRIPKTTGSRTFPDMAVILAGYPTNPPATMGGLKGETLPLVARAMKFRLTVRDNHAGGGGVVTGGEGCQSGFDGTFQVNTISGTGPFTVGSPNGGESFPGGSSQTITWNVAGTNAAPINTTNVKISLSTDGGQTYPTVLTASTPNDGSEVLSLPNITTTTARIKIEAVGNIFFDISDANFSITLSVGFNFSNTLPATASCPAPGTMDITLGTSAIMGFSNPITLSASGNPAGTTISFSQNPITPGSSTVVTLHNTNTLSNNSYTVTITGSANGATTQTKNIVYVIQSGTGPDITGQPQSQTICAGSNAFFNVSANGTGLSYQWQLSTNNGLNFSNIGSNISSQSVAAADISQNNNQYRVMVTGQCNNSVSNAAILTVNARPDITLSAAPLTELLPGQTTTITAALNPAVGGFNYTWFRDDVQIPLISGSSFTADITTIGDYKVKINNPSTGCNNESGSVSIIAKASSRLFIFPSPNQGQFTVSYYNQGGASTQQSLAIYDSKGALVYNRKLAVTSPYQLHSINLKGAGKGVYIVVIGDANGKELAKGKVVIQ